MDWPEFAHMYVMTLTENEFNAIRGGEKPERLSVVRAMHFYRMGLGYSVVGFIDKFFDDAVKAIVEQVHSRRHWS